MTKETTPATGNRPDISIGMFSTLGVEAMDLLIQPPLNSVIIDAQHGHWPLEEIKHGVRAAEARKVKPIVRLPVDGYWMIESLLDFGCMELVFPMVNSAEQARRFARACYYPPLGDRSQATCRGELLYGKSYGEIFQKNFMLRVMIEHRDAVNQLEEILSVPGVGGCLIGPTDLGASMRAVNDNSDVEQIYTNAVAIGRRLGKSMSIAVPDMAQAMERIKQGFDSVIIFSDRKMLLEGVFRLTSTYR